MPETLNLQGGKHWFWLMVFDTSFCLICLELWWGGRSMWQKTASQYLERKGRVERHRVPMSFARSYLCHLSFLSCGRQEIPWQKQPKRKGADLAHSCYSPLRKGSQIGRRELVMWHPRSASRERQIDSCSSSAPVIVNFVSLTPTQVYLGRESLREEFPPSDVLVGMSVEGGRIFFIASWCGRA